MRDLPNMRALVKRHFQHTTHFSPLVGEGKVIGDYTSPDPFGQFRVRFSETEITQTNLSLGTVQRVLWEEIVGYELPDLKVGALAVAVHLARTSVCLHVCGTHAGHNGSGPYSDAFLLVPVLHVLVNNCGAV